MPDWIGGVGAMVVGVGAALLVLRFLPQPWQPSTDEEIMERWMDKHPGFVRRGDSTEAETTQEQSGPSCG